LELPTFDTAIPGFSSLTSTASGNVKDLLAGVPSPDITRMQNAFFGAGSGLDTGSPFLEARAYDLYGQAAEGRKQRGFENFLNMLKSFSGTLVPTSGQLIQESQFERELAEKKRLDALNRRNLQPQFPAFAEYLQPLRSTGEASGPLQTVYELWNPR
jgi:hypothetical protein